MTDQNDGEPDYDLDEAIAEDEDELVDSGYDYPDPDDLDDRSEFADPGGISALRAATPDNPRNRPCPTCGWPNRLTPKDVALGYQCDSCANALERGTDIFYYEGDTDGDTEAADETED